jgi:CDP-diacylglycerol--glycerol-3-phosphate 3-phosphatidyltransferase
MAILPVECCYHYNLRVPLKGAVGMNLPNSLTVVRIFLVPFLVVVLLTEFERQQIFGIPKEWVAAVIFGIASITDWLDGYLARRRRQVTPLGQMLDPIADKLLTSAAFISLVQLNLAPAWMVAIIIGREFAITALRSRAYSKGFTIPAAPLGKIKMASQVTAILLLILGWGPLPWLAPIGEAALWAVMIAALLSAIDYYRRFQVLLNARVTDVNIAREQRRESQGQRANGKSQR